MKEEIKEVEELIVAGVRLYKSPDRLHLIEEKDLRNDLRIYKNTIISQSRQTLLTELLEELEKLETFPRTASELKSDIKAIIESRMK